MGALIEEKTADVFRDRLNELLKSLFDNLRNLMLSVTVILAGRYLLTPTGKQLNPAFNDTTGIVMIGWILVALCLLQGLFEILAIVPRVRKRRTYSDGARAFVFIFVYLPMAVSVLTFLLK